MTDWELILVDDCSTDRSMDIMSGYAKQDSRIIVRYQKENHGPMIARRIGDEMATGDYITYCDADDGLPNNALRCLYDEAVRTDADIISGNYEYHRMDGAKTVTTFTLKYGNDKEGILKSLVNKQVAHCLCVKMFHSSLLKDYDYNIIDHMTNAEDAYMFYQILLHVNKMVQIPNIVYCYMQVPDSSTQSIYSERALDNMCMFNAFRVNYIDLFPSLKNEILASVSDAIVNLKYKGYNKKGALRKILVKYNIWQYGSNLAIIRYHPLPKALKLLIKNNIPPFSY